MRGFSPVLPLMTKLVQYNMEKCIEDKKFEKEWWVSHTLTSFLIRSAPFYRGGLIFLVWSATWHVPAKLLLDLFLWCHVSPRGRQRNIVCGTIVHTQVRVRTFGKCQTCPIIDQSLFLGSKQDKEPFETRPIFLRRCCSPSKDVIVASSATSHRRGWI